jgi:thiopeptide-type bacteriocin biosynthesis protein
MKFLPDFIIRTPLFPITNQVQDNYFSEAIYLASPSLHAERKKFINNLLKGDKELRKFNTSIYKYQSRSCYRCTPFGLFAGLNTGRFTDNSNVVFDQDLFKTLDRKTRLDMNVLCEMAQEISKKEFIKPFLLFFPNTSIYKIGDFYRYVEYNYSKSKRIHKISKVDFSEYLSLIFSESAKGKTVVELANLLVDEDITLDEATNFINELISEQLLIGELEPTVTGDEYFSVIMSIIERVSKINKSEELRELATSLKGIETAIRELDINILNPIDQYQMIFDAVKKILPNISETNLLQTDLFKNPQVATLNSEIQENILETLHFLNKITPKNNNQNLTNFKKRFTERYEDQEMPLLQVLDTETGIGYPFKDTNGINDLVDDLVGYYTPSISEIKWTNVQSTLNRILNKSIADNQYQITLLEEDFADIDHSEKSLPHSFAVRFNVLNTNKNTLVLKGTGGSSAIIMIGRFANGNEQISKIVSELSEFEQKQAGNSILAEIVHLPESRTGNILARPSFRKYEIPYLAKSSVDVDHQIDLSDLSISIRKNQLILRSKRLNRQVIPRLGNAHNFGYNALPVYQFLCELQTQYYEKSYIGFTWGALVHEYEFLPRVYYKNIIVNPATWQLKKRHFELLLKVKNEDECISAFLNFKETHNLPDLFLIVDGDNELLIDTNQKIAILAFIDTLKNRPSVKLIEFLFDMEAPLVKDSEGNVFTNECVGFIVNDETPFPDQEFSTLQEIKSKQYFLLGSEWLYYKIYSGVKTADYILTEKLKPIAEYLIEKGYIDKWFFIRYNDPDNHIRFRLHLKDKSHYGTIISIIHTELDSLIEEGIIYEILTDTYIREIKRYGDNSIELAEDLFYHDSVSCVNSLALLNSEDKDTVRWHIALRATDELLNDFGLSIEEKYNLMEILSKQFFEEHGGNKELKILLGDKFRQHRSVIEKLLNRSIDQDRPPEMGQLIEVIHELSNNQRTTVQKIRDLYESGELQVDFNNLLSSLIHMKLNRAFMSQQRKNEFVIYDLLTRYYKSTIAKVKKQEFC